MKAVDNRRRRLWINPLTRANVRQWPNTKAAPQVVEHRRGLTTTSALRRSVMASAHRIQEPSSMGDI